MKRNFAEKAKAILGSRPSSMEDFLSDEPQTSDQPQAPDAPPIEDIDVKLEIQETVKPSKEPKRSPQPTPQPTEEEDRSERYEWRHTPTMQGRIQLCLLERNKNRKPKDTKVKMVDVIEAAVHAYLKREGY